MYQFFVEPEQVREHEVVIVGSDVNHIGNVLRMKPGERIRVSDNSGRAYFCHIREITSDTVIADIDEADAPGTELNNSICLLQGLPKADKMELIIQKATELGAGEVIPVAMKNCVVRLDAKKAAAKTARWQAIAESAAKQSKRTVIPQIHAPLSWKDALNFAKTLDIVLVPYENERGMDATRELIGSIAPGQSVGILIGPEGGFADSEIQEADALGFRRISLGRRILRTETAGLAALAMLVYQLDE
jgi:16S rRNA (uracil1498-N3)-methyltransferase